MTREQVRALILETGIIPAIRTESMDDARFAAEAVFKGGIPILELTMTVPGALDLLTELRHKHPKSIVGAGTVLDEETAARCLDAGAQFITSPGLDPAVIAFAHAKDIAMIPGALTPSEVMLALRSRVDFVKIFPCSLLGGPAYIKALKAPFPEAPLIASGGVNQVTAKDYLNAGAPVLGIRGELIPKQAIEGRNELWIHELAGRFLKIVKHHRDKHAVNQG
jgi:2-dehydro-3-deoxyphosphogluconate aldolase/(4S)-4-hydroxy-2-oxoglutarate aldolase